MDPIEIRFPIFVFTRYGFEALTDSSDFLVRCCKTVRNGFFESIEFIDSDGVLRRILSVEVDCNAKIHILRHIFYRCRLCKVKIRALENLGILSREEVMAKIVDAICCTPADGASKQFDEDELRYVLHKKKDVRAIIEYFSGPVPDFLGESQIL